LELLPQQTTDAFVRTPQEWFSPELTDRNVPDGAFDSPEPLAPQHTAVASVRTAQACPPPTLTDRNFPDG
jgi:hypothetical protein